jgi:hypothetical protein
MARTYRAGESLEDFCRVCKTDRMHTVVAAAEGVPIRVVCGYCQSEHNYRGGPRVGINAPQPSRTARPDPAGRRTRSDREPFPAVSERERTGAQLILRATNMPNDDIDIEMLLRRIIREETGITPAPPAEKWRNGTLVLKPGNPELQEKTWPIETFFHKVVMVRNRLRTLEQQVNATDLPEDVKVKLQGYISGCYGSLTSFNVLFSEVEDQFRGGGGDD